MKTWVAIGLLMVSQMGFALTSSTVDLGSVSLAPKARGSISYDKLIAGVAYNITCDVVYNNVNGADVYIDAHYAQGAQATLNGKPIINSVMRLRDHYADGETLVISGATSMFSPSLDFTNLDDTTTVTVQQCIAQVDAGVKK